MWKRLSLEKAAKYVRLTIPCLTPSGRLRELQLLTCGRSAGKAQKGKGSLWSCCSLHSHEPSVLFLFCFCFKNHNISLRTDPREMKGRLWWLSLEHVCAPTTLHRDIHQQEYMFSYLLFQYHFTFLISLFYREKMKIKWELCNEKTIRGRTKSRQTLKKLDGTVNWYNLSGGLFGNLYKKIF